MPALLLLLAQQPAAPVPAETVNRRLMEWNKAGDFGAIADYFETLPPRQRVDYMYAWLAALEKARRWERILALCEDPLFRNKEGKSILPNHFKGRALAELGRHREALAWHLASGKGGDLSSYMAGWNEALALGDWASSLVCAEALVGRYPTNGNYLGMKGEALAKLGRYEEAEASLNEAVHLAPGRAMTWADLACCHNEAARYEEALDAASRAVALDAKLMEGWCNKGRARMGLKQYREGRDDYAAALALQPKDPALVANLKLNIDMADKYLAHVNGKKPVRKK
jgi:tetratricopeptide (TPR) repeat protein